MFPKAESVLPVLVTGKLSLFICPTVLLAPHLSPISLGEGLSKGLCRYLTVSQGNALSVKMTKFNFAYVL